MAPLEGTTQGRIVNPYIMEKIGLVDEPFEMEIRDGWVVGLKGGKQAQALQELYERSDENAQPDRLPVRHGDEPRLAGSSPTLGRSPRGWAPSTWPWGTTSPWAARSRAGCHIDIVILNPTVTLDGKVILQDGKLYL